MVEMRNRSERRQLLRQRAGCLLAGPAAEMPMMPLWKVRDISLAGLGVESPGLDIPEAGDLLVDVRRGGDLLVAGAPVRVVRREGQEAGLVWLQLDDVQRSALGQALAVATQCGCLDEAYLKARFSGREALLRDLCRLFAEDGPRKLRSIEAALESGRMEDIAVTAHGLAGVAATLGAPALRQLALTVELTANDDSQETGGQQRLQERIEALRRELAAVLSALPQALAPAG